MEDDIHMRVDCINIRNSAACQGACSQMPWSYVDFLLGYFKHFLHLSSCVTSADLNPPEGKMRDALLQIVCRDGRVISLCADSADDAL